VGAIGQAPEDRPSRLFRDERPGTDLRPCSNLHRKQAKRREERAMTGRIVVGIDGSETSMLAARWAAWEARIRGAEVTLVAAWELPMNAFAFGYVAVSDDLVKGMIKGAEDNLATALEAVRSVGVDLKVETTVVEGQASAVLLKAAENADLLVIGSRGLGGFRELLLGSVSQQCAHHAQCPVVIIRHMAAEAR
jgi:nucleotide-binding universal stress UspA family protein